jgi:glutamine amidotransferase
MQKINEFNLTRCLQTLTQPVLGICLSMQYLFDFLEEGACAGLGIMQGKIQKLAANSSIQVPHMGWNTLTITKECPLLKSIPQNSAVYFVHSYYAEISNHTIAAATHGQSFSAIVQKNNYFGVQFHPERSGEIGQSILQNFLEY